MAREDPPDLLILDVMLPRMSGHDVCRELRKDGRDLPILMLTARDTQQDKITGLDSDDFNRGFIEMFSSRPFDLWTWGEADG